MGLWYLLTFYASMRAMADPHARSVRWAALAVIACALGMASKESMVTAPVMVLLYDARFLRRFRARRARSETRTLRGLAATWMVLIALIPAWATLAQAPGCRAGVTSWTVPPESAAHADHVSDAPVWRRPWCSITGDCSRVAGGSPSVRRSPPGRLITVVGILLLWREASGPWACWRRGVFVTLAPTCQQSSPLPPIVARAPDVPAAGGAVTLGVLGAHVSVSSWLGTRGRWHRTVARTAARMGIACTLGWLDASAQPEYQSEAGIWRTVLARPSPRPGPLSTGHHPARTGSADEAPRALVASRAC